VIRVQFAIPGDIGAPTGGYAYARHVLETLPRCGVEVAYLPLPDGFPVPTAAELEETARLLASVPADSVLLIDGLALGALPGRCLAPIAAPIVALHHHPLGLETGLDAETGRRLLDLERAALRYARQIVVTSQTTADTLCELGFGPPPPVTVALPGTEAAPRARGSCGDRVEILSVGSIVPRKGHDLLIEALAGLTHLDWHCTIAGSLDRASDFASGLTRRIAEARLGDRIRLTGPLSLAEMQELYARADIFALPSRYEGYGMAFAEALARGLPVIGARAGAVPGTVPADAGILVPPDNVPALHDALAALLTDARLRQRLSDAAWAHAPTLPRWTDTARIIADVLRGAAP
jgi:glycosyltransferase involved in cell wall biosynthesis